MKQIYMFLKLWYWWKYKIKKNEFHKDLNMNKKDLKNPQRLMAKRDIAHLLDDNHSIWSIVKNNEKMLERAEI